MINNSKQIPKSDDLLINHFRAYPKMKIVDIFKYIYQSAYGCEHLVSDRRTALKYIVYEYDSVSSTQRPQIERLDGEYCRVHLSCLNGGLSPETLTSLFCHSAQSERNGSERLVQLIDALSRLVDEETLPFDKSEFRSELEKWKASGYGAVRHSEAFRSNYSPAYRVISNKYAEFIRLFTEIDKRLDRDTVTIVIEGGSASGKTTLSGILKEIYDCNVFHMDDFFLRPEQRTAERFAEIGGNVDRERFADEVLSSLQKKETVKYRPFDCSVQALGDAVTVPYKKLNVVEGAYSMHPSFGRYYDLALFLDIGEEYQRARILKRNSPYLANRFFNEWIPLENEYFSKTDIKNRVNMVKNVFPE